ncbi:hypothetical protein HPP92_023256 [Vanilla planifolia]|uniref:Diacylglycerol O-acyltransferase n=1 Tax=Vanilla planifolia TaxID=51239 RepID=A0A835PUY8_VANPL|nr:hypothetical protein HPP92_023256 [Vanilla planifolia]
MGAAEDSGLPRERGLVVKPPRPWSFSSVEEYGEPLSPAARFFRQPQINCHVVAILGLGKIVGADEVKAALKDTLVRHPRFSSIQVVDKSWRKTVRWERAEVNLDDHVIYPVIAASGDSINGDSFVENYVFDLCRSPLDPSRPLWDLHLLAVDTSEAPMVAVLRIHHSLGDGVSLMSLLFACTRRTSDFESLPSLPEARRRVAAAGTGFGACKLLFLLWTFIVYAWNTLVDAFLFICSAVFLKDSKTPLFGVEGVEYRPKRFVHRTISLDDVKAIKKAMDCTVNDVLVGITSAALSRYLERNYDGNLPQNLMIRSTVLVNIRPSPGINELAYMMKAGSRAKWGNRLGYVILRFPIMNVEDPLDYIRKGIKVAERKKKSFEAVFTYGSALLIVKSLGIKAAACLCHRVISNTSLSFSNMVGPIEEVGFCGSPLVYIAPSVYGHPQALTIHFQSYMKKMKVVLAVDEHVIPEPHKLLEDIAHSIEVIKDAATASP